MNELLKALASNSVAITTLIISFGAIVLSLILTYLIAFFQGREVAYWPPKIGKKPDKQSRTNVDVKNNLHTAAEGFFTTWESVSSSFKERLNKAETFQLLAVMTSTLLTENESRLQQLMNRDGKIQCILVNPKGHAVKMAAERSYGAESELDTMHNLIESGLKSTSAIGKNKENFQVKLIDHLPSAIVTILDPEKSDGVAYVTLYGFGQFYLNRPTFILHKEKDKQWFNFYAETFENMWKSGESQLLDLSKAVIAANNAP